MNQQVTYDRIMQTAMGFWASKTLMSAVELGIFDTLAGGPLDAKALRLRVGVHERSARDFFDALVALGLLQRDKAGLYTNSREAARFLDRASPNYIGGIIEMFNARLYGFWGSLTEALRSAEPQNEAKSGGDLFANLYADPVRLEGFLRGMTGITTPVADALAGGIPVEDGEQRRRCRLGTGLCSRPFSARSPAFDSQRFRSSGSGTDILALRCCPQGVGAGALHPRRLFSKQPAGR